MGNVIPFKPRSDASGLSKVPSNTIVIYQEGRPTVLQSPASKVVLEEKMPLTKALMIHSWASFNGYEVTKIRLTSLITAALNQGVFHVVVPAELTQGYTPQDGTMAMNAMLAEG